jgi:hypothetical protein
LDQVQEAHQARSHRRLERLLPEGAEVTDTMPRDKLVAAAKKMRKEGFTWKMAADRLGVSHEMLRRLLYHGKPQQYHPAYEAKRES